MDAVGVLTDPGSHTELALAAIRAGKHVLVEKPLALVVSDAARLVREANSAGVVAMTGFHMRFHRLMKPARERIARGELGEIESIRVIWHSPRGDEGIADWKMARASGGGALVEIAVHHLDLIRYLLGSEFEWVHAASKNGTREDETAVLTAKNVGRRSGDGRVFGAKPARDRDCRQRQVGLAARRLLEIRRLFSTGTIGKYPVVPRYASAPWQPSCIISLRACARFMEAITLTPIRHSWKHFIGCVRQGIPPTATFEDGLRAVEAVTAAIESVTAASLNR